MSGSGKRSRNPGEAYELQRSFGYSGGNDDSLSRAAETAKKNSGNLEGNDPSDIGEENNPEAREERASCSEEAAKKL